MDDAEHVEHVGESLMLAHDLQEDRLRLGVLAILVVLARQVHEVAQPLVHVSPSRAVY